MLKIYKQFSLLVMIEPIDEACSFRLGCGACTTYLIMPSSDLHIKQKGCIRPVRNEALSAKIVFPWFVCIHTYTINLLNSMCQSIVWFGMQLKWNRK